MTDQQHDNPPPDERECDNTPKLTADEWAYVQAVTEAGDD